MLCAIDDDGVWGGTIFPFFITLISSGEMESHGKAELIKKASSLHCIIIAFIPPKNNTKNKKRSGPFTFSLTSKTAAPRWRIPAGIHEIRPIMHDGVGLGLLGMIMSD